MFTIKQLEAKSTSPAGIAPGAEFGGTFTVPSYRSGLFLDPKVRACFERGERVAREYVPGGRINLRPEQRACGRSALRARAAGGRACCCLVEGLPFPCRLPRRTPIINSRLLPPTQGRGGTTGYDNAGALVGLEADGGEGQEELFKETNKVYQVR